ncbi:putative WD repeat-containing protein [Cladobotryum mycophilum]|uniref:WD repeat-containing protein n=1 Tax=Cladobotryum mycophilum TaxID=491253 RepID=A0ABR0SKZ7_9HYPO
MVYSLTRLDQYHFPGRGDVVYVLEAHRTAAGLATIASDQGLSLFDPARIGTGPLAGSVTEHGNVTALRVFDAGNSLVCTAGENGSVGVWDWRIGGGGGGGAGARVAQFQASQASILSMACSPGTQTIAVGTELENHTASICLWDVRSTPSPKAQYDEVHSDDITSLSFHPSQPTLLLSGSTDGLVSAHDTTIADEDDLTVQTFNHNASIHDAAFVSQTEVFALSHDEAFALYDMEQAGGDAAQNFGDMRGCWGVMEPSSAREHKTFELVYLAKSPQNSWILDLDNRVSLPGAHGGEIVRSFCFFDDENVVFTTGEDGSIKAWGPGG